MKSAATSVDNFLFPHIFPLRRSGEKKKRKREKRRPPRIRLQQPSAGSPPLISSFLRNR